MNLRKSTSQFLIACALCLLFFPAASTHAQDKPNIVLVFMDNFGWGEPGFNGGGVTRGAATPRIDQIANEGLRLTNFNDEAQCTPSRSAIIARAATCPSIAPSSVSAFDRPPSARSRRDRRSYAWCWTAKSCRAPTLVYSFCQCIQISIPG